MSPGSSSSFLGGGDIYSLFCLDVDWVLSCLMLGDYEAMDATDTMIVIDLWNMISQFIAVSATVENVS